MNNPKARSSILGLAGAYLLYLAWEMYEDMRKGVSTMAPTVNILFIVLFALAGIGVVILAWRVWAGQKKENPEEKPPREEEKEDSLRKG